MLYNVRVKLKEKKSGFFKIQTYKALADNEKQALTKARNVFITKVGYQIVEMKVVKHNEA